jgi:hypothetical protein
VSHFGTEVVASPGPAQTTERRQGLGFPLFTLRPRRHLGNGLENRQARERLVGSNPTPSAFWEEPFAAAVLTRQKLRRPFWPSGTATRNAPGHGQETYSTAHSCVDEADASDSHQTPFLIICLNPRDILVREARSACPCGRHRLQPNHNVAAAARRLSEHCPTVVIRERLFGPGRPGPQFTGRSSAR